MRIKETQEHDGGQNLDKLSIRERMCLQHKECPSERTRRKRMLVVGHEDRVFIEGELMFKLIEV